jgi:aspartyl-tRNA synthetase
MERTLIKDTKNKVGETVLLKGWVDNRRDHGKLIFIDLRDASAKVQTVVSPKNQDVHDIAETCRTEWVLAVEGEVKKRPDELINPKEELGEIEISVTKIEILNEAKTPVFDVTTDGMEVNEEIRLKYRYLDLRRGRLQKNLRMRAKIIKFIRDFLTERNFTETETPLLTKSTPEGARDFVVPSRLHTGKFYALPQSPQQYKQLLMAGGLERYFQIAKCIRDEDTRGDRQPEFTQLDMEISFVEQEEVMKLNEELLIELVTKLYPEKKIQEIPFPRLTYKETMEKHGTDRPDLRKDKEDQNLLAFCWIIDFPFFEKTDNGSFTFTHNPFSAPKQKHMNWLMEKENINEILTTQYDIVMNGLEIGGGSIRNHKPEALKRVFEIMGYEEEKIVNNFGHMLEALESGTPPHGGIAWGLDRFISILQNEPNIREVIAFPKTGDGRDLMMNAPSEISKEQLRELGLDVKK